MTTPEVERKKREREQIFGKAHGNKIVFFYMSTFLPKNKTTVYTRVLVDPRIIELLEAKFEFNTKAVLKAQNHVINFFF